ncbi:MAG: NAD-dependent succinate-semialdehyde dehydrogenase [Casimicrobiaceae bacterium]|nr:NAD-dependent succinate-semialdehyde dehydrogenase [Casimicrobiaceae bacterium]MDW8312636.1 NAD-dependent succinate-semialdehyde dehydrogenase [Burkholderiales bacterium]
MNPTSTYPNTQLLIDGQWCDALDGRTLPVFNPATGEEIGRVAHASTPDLDRALAAAEKGFEHWRRVPALERSRIMREAARLMRERAEAIARILTLEQGKPLAEARIEATFAAEVIEWFAEEGRRVYGRVVPPRHPAHLNLVLKEPVGPVAAFTPWNFPINQVVRKVSAALATGCSIIVKAPEETPASPAALIRAFCDAGVPPGVINLVFGVPAEISAYLIPHPVIRKVSFTGSVPVGKQLAALAGQHMKRVTMELGGHAPVIVAEDADLDLAIKSSGAAKFRNAGQVCIAPTRFLVQESIRREFVEKLAAYAEAIPVGDGLAPETRMGPLANPRRLAAMQAFTEDAVAAGAQVATGGTRIGERGNFFRPTILVEPPVSTRLMNEEPFGPIAAVKGFRTIEEAIAEANRLPYGLAGYAFTRSIAIEHKLRQELQVGLLWINQPALAIPEMPFGGVKDSGYGSEGGSEALEAYLNTKSVFTNCL